MQGLLLGREQLVPASRGGLGLGARPQARAGRRKLLHRRLAAAGGLGLGVAAPPRLARVLALLLALAAACTTPRPPSSTLTTKMTFYADTGANDLEQALSTISLLRLASLRALRICAPT